MLAVGAIGVAESVAGARLTIADFEQGLPEGTQEKSFVGQTNYRVVAEDRGQVLQADSRGQASALLFPQEFDPARWPWLEWRWKVSHPLEKGDARYREGDDYAARVYVIFPHWWPTRSRSIIYIWANRLPEGAAIANAFTGNARMLALQSGKANCGRWIRQRRNLVEDYRRLFGEEPPNKAVLAIMTDTDQTGESARAWYDDLVLSR